MTFARRFTAFLSALMIFALAGCAQNDDGQRRATGQYIDDTVVTAKVKSALIADPDLKASDIQVDTYRGTVQLSGFVATAEQVTKAEQVAREIQGVQAVKNVISLRQ